MEIVNLQSWNDFEDNVQALQQIYAGSSSSFLYRGHPNSTWMLQTTLERLVGPNMRVDYYFDLIEKIKSRIETFTNRSWDLPRKEFHEWLRQKGIFSTLIPGMEYMAYLRHHGFPSPLLDWTKSPFIAAYFAFRDVANTADSVAIYGYIEQLDEGKFDSGAGGNIWRLWENVRTHPRHFLQQSVYTICLAGKAEDQYFFSHEAVFAKPVERQDLIWKFVLPATERVTALSKLDSYNINAYSIFQSEDSLMETVFLRELGFAKILALNFHER